MENTIAILLSVLSLAIGVYLLFKKPKKDPQVNINSQRITKNKSEIEAVIDSMEELEAKVPFAIKNGNETILHFQGQEIYNTEKT